MRNLFALILIVTGIAGLGIYLGWFHISLESGFGKSRATFTVDKGKIQQDKDKALGRAQDLHDKVATATNKSNEVAHGRRT